MFEIMMNKKASEMNIKVLNNRIMYLNSTEQKANRQLALAKKRANEISKIKRSKFEYSQDLQNYKHHINNQLSQKRREISDTRKKLKDSINYKQTENLHLKRKMRHQIKSLTSQGLEKRKMISLYEQRQKEIEKINCLAEKYRNQNKRNRGIQRRMSQLKQLYSQKKIFGLMNAENNVQKAEKLERVEEELMQKLHTTYQKVNEFMEQSNSFDNFANIEYNTKYLKPLSRVEKNEDKSKTNRSVQNMKPHVIKED